LDGEGNPIESTAAERIAASNIVRNLIAAPCRRSGKKDVVKSFSLQKQLELFKKT
jgi:hypothetical protein